MQDKWYGDLRFWKFSRVGVPLDPTRKLTSSAVKKISSQLLTGTWHLCYCRWGNIQWLYAQMTPHWKPREFNSLIKHCYLQFHFNITSHKPQRLKKKSLSSYAHASFTLPPCPSGEGFVQCWYTGVICLWQKHCISSPANYNGQHMRSSSLSAWDPRKGMPKILSAVRDKIFVGCLALKPNVAQLTHTEQNQISCSYPISEDCFLFAFNSPCKWFHTVCLLFVSIKGL